MIRKSDPKVKDIHAQDRAFSRILKGASIALFVLLVSIGVFLFWGARPAIQKFGVGFLFTQTWDPVREIFGALPVIVGTLVSSFVAVCLAAPVSVGIALFLNELAPEKTRRPIGFLIEMLAAIPSVVYGLWGIFVLAPFLRSSVEPWLAKYFGILPIFHGPAYGVGMMAASLILAIMITPTISSICREVFSSIPQSNREAALALGATRWETLRLTVIGGSKQGILGAVILGLGRAIGETMAVTMVIGNRAELSASLFAPSQTMASVIANEYAEATSAMHSSALMGVGFSLFLVTLVIHVLVRIFLLKGVRA